MFVILRTNYLMTFRWLLIKETVVTCIELSAMLHDSRKHSKEQKYAYQGIGIFKPIKLLHFIISKSLIFFLLFYRFYWLFKSSVKFILRCIRESWKRILVKWMFENGRILGISWWRRWYLWGMTSEVKLQCLEHSRAWLPNELYRIETCIIW